MEKNRIRERRTELKMTQEELCAKTGLSRATISSLENNEGADMKISTLKALAEALDCEPHSLFV